MSLYDEHGTTLRRHDDCHICGQDEIGSTFDDAWCHFCGWSGTLQAHREAAAEWKAHEERGRQACAIAAAACAHVTAEGSCANLPEDHDPEYDGHYCSEADCTYCALCRAMEGYDDQG